MATYSVSPELEAYIKTRIFPFNRAQGLEFFDRLMNLCDYDYPMTPDLRGLVQSKFGFDMLHIIEQFGTLWHPVLPPSMRNSIRGIIPDALYLEFIRIFDCDCCPAIIQQIADISYAVDGTAAGQLTVVLAIDESQNQLLSIYEWDGANWVVQIDTITRAVDGEFIDYGISIPAGSWELSVDGGVSWTDTNATFDPPVSSFSVMFRNTVTGCTYSGWNMAFPLDIFCFYWSNLSEWSVFVEDGFLVSFGTINGVPTDTVFLPYGGQYYFQQFIDNTLPPITTWGMYNNEFTDPPRVDVPVPVYGSTCGANCYQAVFTVDDVNANSFTQLIYTEGLGSYDYNSFTALSDPDVAAQTYLNFFLMNQILEPSATWNISLNGNEVTMTVCTVMQLTGGYWGDEVSNLGTFTFTQL
jgi:hypothetical protein